MTAAPTPPTLPVLLRALCLPTFAREYAAVAEQAAREGLSHEVYLHTLAAQEASDRAARRVERLIAESKLPAAKASRALKRRGCRPTSAPHLRGCATARS